MAERHAERCVVGLARLRAPGDHRRGKPRREEVVPSAESEEDGYSRRRQPSSAGRAGQALQLEPGTTTLTPASRQYIAETLTFSALFLLTMMLMVHKAPLNTPYPTEVFDALSVGSPEIALITQRFVDFLEQGLAAE